MRSEWWSRFGWRGGRFPLAGPDLRWPTEDLARRPRQERNPSPRAAYITSRDRVQGLFFGGGGSLVYLSGLAEGIPIIIKLILPLRCISPPGPFGLAFHESDGGDEDVDDTGIMPLSCFAT